MKNYYDVLGVAKDASASDIKKAYLKLARQTHPDVAGPGSEEQFKEVSAAYEVLSDPERRRLYDMGGEDALRGAGAGPTGGFGAFSDIFETFFGGGAAASRGPIPRGQRARDTLVGLSVSLRDAVFGTHSEVTVNTYVVCPTCDGHLSRPGSHATTCSACQGRGSVQKVARSFLGQIMTTQVCSACQGHGDIITDPCHECNGDGRVRTRSTVPVEVPAGVQDGARLRMPQAGDVGPGGGPRGDLFVEFSVASDPMFERRGDDLVTSVSIPFTAAALGTTITLETFDGPREIPLKAGTQPGHSETLKGLGVTRLHTNRRGNIDVFVDVDVPTHIDDEQRELLEKLAALRGEERPPAKQVPGEGMFSKLRNKIGL